MSASQPQVFVDDSDPNMVYRGEDTWAVQTGISTALQPFILPAPVPFYGTMHQVKGNGSFSYIYRGRDVSTLFSSAASKNDTFYISSCMIDGEEVADGFENLFQCKSSDDLQDGEHNITVLVVTQNSSDLVAPAFPPYFDGLFYTPSIAAYTSQAQELDLSYTPLQALSVGIMNMTSGGSFSYTFSLPGDAIDFDFNGTSMAIYALYQLNVNDSTVPVNLSYKVDGGQTINFTLDRPFNEYVTELDDQLILQTPQYAPGHHRLHLEFSGPASKNQALVLENFVVQNAPSTRKLALPPFPPVPSIRTTSTAQATPSPTIDNTSTIKSASHHTAPRTIATVAATLSAVLALLIFSVLYIKRRSLRRIFSSRDNSNAAEVNVTPFIPGIFARRMHSSSKRMPDSVPNPARVAQNVSNSKANQLVPPSHDPMRAAAPLPQPVPTPMTHVHPPGAVAIPAGAPASPAAEEATEEPIYRIHEDGGSVHQDSSTTAPRERQVIDLPPLYSSNFGRRPEPAEDSNTGAD